MNSVAPVLEINDLHRAYGKVEALRGISLSLSGPGVFGFLGPNGAGKTTTIKIIAGLLRPTSGRVRVEGADVQADRVTALRDLGVMMETPRFYEYLSGHDNLKVLATFSGNGASVRIPSLLDRVGLAAKAHARVSSYSRGMRQRLGFAAALLSDPKLLILDEPTNGLDPAGIASVREWLVTMAKDEGRTVFLSSHQMGEVERVCDTVTIINDGRIVASGRTDELIRAKNTISVRTPDTGAAETVLRRLDGAGTVTIAGADHLRIESSSLSPSAITRALVNAGVEITEISAERESLEESFFRLVGSKNDVV